MSRKRYEQNAHSQWVKVQSVLWIAILSLCILAVGLSLLYYFFGVQIPVTLRAIIFIVVCWILWTYKPLAVAATRKKENAAQGARAEEDVAFLLDKCLPEDWAILENEDVGYGDIDFIVRSPKNNHYIIDVKSHKGEEKFIRNGTLYKKVQGQVYRFDSKKCPFQALALQAKLFKKKYPEYNTVWITTILCFTEGSIQFTGERPPYRCLMTTKKDLVYLLKKLDRKKER